MKFETRLKEKRKSAELTMREVADKIGMTTQGYKRIEDGICGKTFEKLPTLAKTLGCRIDDLFPEMDKITEDGDRHATPKERKETNEMTNEKYTTVSYMKNELDGDTPFADTGAVIMTYLSGKFDQAVDRVIKAVDQKTDLAESLAALEEATRIFNGAYHIWKNAQKHSANRTQENREGDERNEQQD